MIRLLPVPPAGAAGLRVLCLGAHADDIEIGAGGTLLRLLADKQVAAVTWVVFSSTPERAREARASAEAFLADAPASLPRDIRILAFTDGLLPQLVPEVKAIFEQLKAFNPDLILTHYRHDLHQDHRLLSELTWNTFRSHLVLEYEIPKYDGDLGNPGCFVELPAAVLDRKVELLLRHFPSQAGKHWFDAETFRALPRLRGMQAACSGRYAEAFYTRKVLL
ncbi:PIG-L deacetylase family protein [Hymenobacter jeollabukensis]|uniref:PIG-L family deacetylase n=1 Tax=Hymenobacter jeollabukensis TaxID=2025313 RepID=A0A5R8WX68_9BACT|nr:PIG-L family deacetylase [Hymenobacter jeollabukensis]TLM97121.1 PIG-L family deacetylase [Hymenobacter jeollabukensis]